MWLTGNENKLRLTMPRQLYAFLFLMLLPLLLRAQVLNDDCADAIPIDNPSNYCSPVGGFSNEGATPSGFSAATCFSESGKDVWFSFVPIATTITITVIGVSEPGNTLAAPELALYQGDCGNSLSEWRCVSDLGNGIVEFTRGNLLIGERYYIRVQGRGLSEGSFELCTRNFNPPVEPGQDCPTMAVLCNKEAFVVQQISGPGEDPTEANDASCFSSAIGTGNVESASTWLSWTALNDGTLTFDLIPLNPTDDLDFALYELPNGPANCDGKILLRCMASSCIGATGLRDGEIDLGEPPNCDDPRQNNYLRPLDMEAGKTYAIMVNNFSETGNGFDVRFGGTGEFQGPEAEISSDDPDGILCLGEEISFTDISRFPDGTISEWTWDFGPTATRQSATGPGPHTVAFTRPGTKSIVLTIGTEEGCQVTEVGNVVVEPCCVNEFEVEALITDETCANLRNGRIDVTVNQGIPPYRFAWSNGATTEDLQGVPPGAYQLTITDATTCDTTLTFVLGTAPPFDVAVSVNDPSCDGGMDGSITLAVSEGQAPYAYNWENVGYNSDNTLSGLGNGDYQVVIRDAANCTDTLSVAVRELDIAIDTAQSVIDPPSCFGATDGEIELRLRNGQEPYLLNWNDGQGPRSLFEKDNLPTGTYTVQVIDANRCRGSLAIDLTAPPPLLANPQVMSPSCADSQDGEVELNVNGGTAPYTYFWEGQPVDSTVAGLDGGTYALRVVDANNCLLEQAVPVDEPSPLTATVSNVVDVRCFGEASGAITLSAEGGVGPYVYGLNEGVLQSDPTIGQLPAGVYQLRVEDAQGCTGTTTGTVDQPPPLVAEAGPDVVVRLGNQVQLSADASDPLAAYAWSPAESLSCARCNDPVAFPLQNTQYVLEATDPNGCVALDSVWVRISPERPVFFPNAFSPDGDGENDYFGVFGGPGLRQVRSLRIFDRWGNLLFERENVSVNNPSTGWDGRVNGRELTTGVYVYLAEVEFIDDVVLEYGGDVLLLR